MWFSICFPLQWAFWNNCLFWKRKLSPWLIIQRVEPTGRAAEHFWPRCQAAGSKWFASLPVSLKLVNVSIPLEFTWTATSWANSQENLSYGICQHKPWSVSTLMIRAQVVCNICRSWTIQPISQKTHFRQCWGPVLFVTLLVTHWWQQIFLWWGTFRISISHPWLMLAPGEELGTGPVKDQAWPCRYPWLLILNEEFRLVWSRICLA